MSWNTWRSYPLELRERAVRMVVESRRSLTRFSGQPVRETGSGPVALVGRVARESPDTVGEPCLTMGADEQHVRFSGRTAQRSVVTDKMTILGPFRPRGGPVVALAADLD